MSISNKCWSYNIRSETFDIHLFGLGLEGRLVRDDGLDNLRVEEDDDDHGQGVIVDERVQDVALVVPVLGQVIVAARHQKALY
jgi:hypothetical protein